MKKRNKDVRNGQKKSKDMDRMRSFSVLLFHSQKAIIKRKHADISVVK